MTDDELEVLRVAAQTAAGELLRVSTMPFVNATMLIGAADAYRRCLQRYHLALHPGAIEGMHASRLEVKLLPDGGRS